MTAKELLNGSVPRPPEADALYRALNAKIHNLGSTGTMYQRNSGEESPRTYNFKSTNISAPGTLRQPPPLRNGQPPQQPAASLYAANNAAPPPYQSTSPSNYGQTYDHQKIPSYGNGAGVATTTRAPPPPPPSRKPHEETARALYDFNGEQSGDLSFREGDIITIVQKSESQDDWWTGRIGGRQGIVSQLTTDALWTTRLTIFFGSSRQTMCNYSNSGNLIKLPLHRLVVGIPFLLNSFKLV